MLKIDMKAARCGQGNAGEQGVNADCTSEFQRTGTPHLLQQSFTPEECQENRCVEVPSNACVLAWWGVSNGGYYLFRVESVMLEEVHAMSDEPKSAKET